MARPIRKRIEFAAQSRLAGVEHLAPRFFAEVVQRDYGDFMITDLSDLHDILDAAKVEMALDRMDEHFLVDSRACDSTRIVDLLEMLHERGVSS
jgi:hypothetical protein